MLVTWSLFVMWVVFNLVDVAISWLGVQFGCSEVAFLIGGALVYFKKNDWLALLALGTAGLCIWDGWAFVQQIGGAP